MRKLLMTLATATLALAVPVGCSSGDEAADDVAEPATTSRSEQTAPPVDTATPATAAEMTESTPTTQATPTTTPAPTAAPIDTTVPAPSAEPVDIADVGLTDPAVTEPAVAVCEAFGELATEGGIDALLALFTPDAVVIDAITGEQYSGTEELAAYFASLVPAFGIEASDCGPVAVQSGDWVAGTYTLHGADGPISQGVAAVHVTDGKVDRQINHYTPVSNALQPPVDAGTGVFSIAMQTCGAWADGDADRARALMSPDIVLHTRRDFVGPAQVAAFVGGLPYDIHTCGVEIQNHDWQAVESIMTDPATGIERSMLHVLHVTPDQLVAEHWTYFDDPA